jgi:hypothetical protein
LCSYIFVGTSALNKKIRITIDLEKWFLKIRKSLESIILYYYCFFEIGSNYVAQAGLEWAVLSTQSLECWDYRHATPHSVSKQYFLRGFFDYFI